MEHFLTADCKSAETPSGAEETYPTGQKIDEWLKSEERPDRKRARLAVVAAETERP